MMKKLMSLGLAGILSASLLVGCSSNNDSKDDDTVTIKYVDENGNVKREKVTKDEAKQIERKQQTTDTDKKETQNLRLWQTTQRISSSQVRRTNETSTK